MSKENSSDNNDIKSTKIKVPKKLLKKKQLTSEKSDTKVKSALSTESKTGELHLRHNISPDGYYKGNKVIETKSDQEVEVANIMNDSNLDIFDIILRAEVISSNR